MTVCAFHLKGHCRYGNSCKYEHVEGSNKNSNPLPGPDSFSVVAKAIQEDLLKEKPAYYLSVYSPNKSSPNIIHDTDLSPEELRFQAYQARASNTIAQYISHESQLLQKMDAVIQLVSSSPMESYKHFYHTQMPLNHPNSTFRKATPGVTAFGGNSFGSSNSTSAFGQPASAFGTPTISSFGAFGQQNQATTVSTFGQPSPVRSGVSAFGQPQSPFGATQSQPNTVTAFGKPSPFGSPAPVASAFGSTTPATSAFGSTTPATSAFGLTKPATSAFGSTPPALSAFGSTAPATSAFGSTAPVHSAFGSTAPAHSAFGSTTPTPSAFGSTTATPSAFGSTTPTPSAFGQPSRFGTTQPQPMGVTAFGKPSAFGANTQPTGTSAVTAFGQPALNNQTTTAFGQPANLTPATSFGQPSPFGQPASANAFGTPSAFGQSAFGKTSSFSSPTTNPSSTASASVFGQPPVTASAPVFAHSPSTLDKNQTSSSTGFAAFSGAAPNLSKASNDSGMSNTTPPEPSEGTKPQNQNVQPSTKTSTTAPLTSAFQQQNTLKSSPKTAPNSIKNTPVETIKTLDPFWEDAPIETDLTPDILEAFKSEMFAWGSIPYVPPPITLR